MTQSIVTKGFANLRFAEGLALGVFLTCLITLAGYYVTLDDRLAWLEKDWLALLAIIGPIFASLLALYGLRRQTQAHFDVVTLERQAKLDAAKATLPLALSQLVQFCDEKIAGIVARHQAAEDDNPYEQTSLRYDMNPSAPMPNRLDDDVLLTLKECIEFADPSAKDWLRIILSRYQVCVAIDNRPGVRVRISNPIASAEYITRWCVLKAVALHLFDYSRGKPRVDSKFDHRFIHPAIDLRIPTSLNQLLDDALARERERLAPYDATKFDYANRTI